MFERESSEKVPAAAESKTYSQEDMDALLKDAKRLERNVEKFSKAETEARNELQKVRVEIREAATQMAAA